MPAAFWAVKPFIRVRQSVIQALAAVRVDRVVVLYLNDKSGTINLAEERLRQREQALEVI